MKAADMSATMIKLNNNKQWEERYEIRSQSSSRTYIIARNKANGTWGCSCRGWIHHGRCKHLDSFLMDQSKEFE